MSASSPPSRRPPPRLSFAAAASLTTAALAAVLLWHLNAITQSPPQHESPSQNRDAASRAAFFSSTASPLLEAAHSRHAAALQRALDAIDTTFASYSDGAPKFANALTGWGLRFKILYRKGVESAERKPDHSWTAALVQEQFNLHVVSEQKLEADLRAILAQLSFDLEASRNELAASLDAALRTSDFPVSVKTDTLASFSSALSKDIPALLASMPNQSVAVGTGSLAAGFAAEEAVRNLIRVVMAQAAARIATSAAAAGGAAASASAAGAAGGTALAPGIGTIIGVAGGFIAGAAVDWWMTDAFEEKITAQTRSFLSQSKSALVEGDHGLASLLRSEISRHEAATTAALRSSLSLPQSQPQP
jgi:hypothetical protein